MLNKLMKYDFKNIGKQLLPYYVVLLIVATINRVLELLVKEVPVLSVIATPIKVIFIIMLVGVLFYTFFVIIRRYYINIFKDEGYLTNTLPVKKSSIIISKILVSLGFCIVSTIIFFIALFIGIENTSGIINTINTAITSAGLPLTITYIFIGFGMLLSITNYILIFFASIALGSTRLEQKVLYSVVYGFVLYMATEMVALAVIGLLLLINNNILDELAASTNIASNLTILMTLSYSIVIIGLGAYYCIANHVLNKKLNLE